MDQIIDFSGCPRAHRTYGGSDRKFGVVYDGDVYMLKFSEGHAKKSDISTSYVNNVISEYISSHIAKSIGLPAHETVLGMYNNEVVVGCKDFRDYPSTHIIEFSEYVHAKYDSGEIGRSIRLDQIYQTLNAPENNIPLSLQEETIRRYWDTFVVDALVGNFDRHVGNWGYLFDGETLRLAPTYDFGSTLFPQASDDGAKGFLGSEFEMMKRSLVFPSPALVITDRKVGKVGYYDMLASNYDPNCTKAVLRIMPLINMDKIRSIIDQTPLITDLRKDFYKNILQMRYELILERAFVRCVNQEFDHNAMLRLQSGHQFSTEDLLAFMERRNAIKDEFADNEKSLSSGCFSVAQMERQKYLTEEYGLHSAAVWKQAIREYQSLCGKENEEPAYRKTKGSFTLLCGLPFSQKTQIASAIALSKSDPLVISKSDYQAIYLSADETFRHICRTIQDGIKDGKDVIYDAVNLKPETRHAFYQIAKEAGAVSLEMVYVKSSLRDITASLKQSSLSVPILKQMQQTLADSNPMLDDDQWDDISIRNAPVKKDFDLGIGPGDDW